MEDRRKIIIGALAVAAVAVFGFYTKKQAESKRIDITPEPMPQDFVQPELENSHE